MTYLTIFLFIGLTVAQRDYNYDDYDFDKSAPSDPALANGGCVCVPFYLCSKDGVNKFGKTIIQARSQESEFPADAQVCGPFHICCSNPIPSNGEPNNNHNTRTPHVPRCGVRNVEGITGRILSTNDKIVETKFGEWPWQAALLKEETPNIFNFLCGASLIDDQHVVTVAHCVNKFTSGVHKSLVVRLGEWDAQSTSEASPHENYLVNQIFVHPKFKADTLINDIAILRLNTSVFLKPYIDTVCLPNDNDIYDGQRCIVTGWGMDAYENGRYSSTLRQVTVPVIEQNRCQAQLRETRLGNFFQLYNGFICAGGERDVDSCKGDGGGPLSCLHTDGRYRLVGLVSWGLECGKENVPGVYVRIQKYLRWITRITQKPLQDYWPKN